jgi:hypothetical protein
MTCPQVFSLFPEALLDSLGKQLTTYMKKQDLILSFVIEIVYT